MTATTKPLTGAGLPLLMVVTAGLIVLGIHEFNQLDAPKQAEVAVSALASLAGTAVAAGLAFWFAFKQFSIQASHSDESAKIDRTYSLSKEFNSSAMFRARGAADKIIEAHPTKTYSELYELLSEKESNYVFLIPRFYERLWFLVDADRLDPKMVCEMFGSIFLWWYVVSFDSQVLPLNWELGARLKKLYEWFRANADGKEFSKWLKDAQEDQQRRVSAAAAAPAPAPTEVTIAPTAT